VEPAEITGVPGLTILGRVMGSLHRAGVSKEMIDPFTDKAISSDYEHLLDVARRWVLSASR
jgi:hypothetical protein